MDQYYIGCDIDGYLHIYKENYDPPFTSSNVRSEACELSWQGLLFRVRPRYFHNWIEKPREVGDEFELFGQKWLVVDRWYDRDELVCTRANAVGYRLLLHNLIWKTEMRLLWRSWDAGIPMWMMDALYRDPQFETDINELKSQFGKERDESTAMV